MVDLAAGIEPGSTEYGDRQTLEAGLATLPSAPGGAPAPSAPAGGGAPPINGVTDPLGALMSGVIDPGQSGALTDGLSVGPGTPPPGQGEAEQPVKTRLREIAMNARSPVLRAIARNELRRLTRQAKL